MKYSISSLVFLVMVGMSLVTSGFSPIDETNLWYGSNSEIVNERLSIRMTCGLCASGTNLLAAGFGGWQSEKQRRGHEIMALKGFSDGDASAVCPDWFPPSTFVLDGESYEISWHSYGYEFSVRKVGSRFPIRGKFHREFNGVDARVYGFASVFERYHDSYEDCARQTVAIVLDSVSNTVFLASSRKGTLIHKNLFVCLGTNSLRIAAAVLNAGLPELDRIGGELSELRGDPVLDLGADGCVRDEEQVYSLDYEGLEGPALFQRGVAPGRVENKTQTSYRPDAGGGDGMGRTRTNSNHKRCDMLAEYEVIGALTPPHREPGERLRHWMGRHMMKLLGVADVGRGEVCTNWRMPTNIVVEGTCYGVRRSVVTVAGLEPFSIHTYDAAQTEVATGSLKWRADGREARISAFARQVDLMSPHSSVLPLVRRNRVVNLDPCTNMVAVSVLGDPRVAVIYKNLFIDISAPTNAVGFATAIMNAGYEAVRNR